MSRRLLSTARSLHRHNHHHHNSSPSRNLSSKAPQLIEIDLEASDSDAAKLVKLEEMVYTIMVNKAAPSWLPFVPGSSYWVPPRPNSIAKVLTQLSSANYHKTNQTIGGSFDEFINSAHRIWPSPSYFIYDNKTKSPVHAEEKDSEKGDVVVEVEVVQIPKEDEK